MTVQIITIDGPSGSGKAHWLQNLQHITIFIYWIQGLCIVY